MNFCSTETATARSLGLMSCHGCGLVLDVSCGVESGRYTCCRCGAALRLRRPDAIARCWAYLIAATLLYIPANLLPIMQTSTLFENHRDTILSGVVTLWKSGSWDLAIIVFVASIVVPMLKIIVLVMLLFTTRRGTDWCLVERTRLYRIVEFVGQWSMLDVFVVALLVTLVHFQSLANVSPGPGVIPFGAVVVLTMLASLSFDPRLMWDAATESPSSTRRSPP